MRIQPVAAVTDNERKQPNRILLVYAGMNAELFVPIRRYTANYLGLLKSRSLQCLFHASCLPYYRIGPMSRIGLLLAMVFLTSTVIAASEPYPEFTAVYDARINGFTMAEVKFSLRRLDNGDYLYQRKSIPGGVASFFGNKESAATSRWRFTNSRIQVLEYQSRDDDGDADDNLHLIYDWKNARVNNVNDADPWQTEIPQGTLDKLVMHLALLLELRDGNTEFKYPLAHEGRIKHYSFKQTGTEEIKLSMGKYDALVVERLNEDHDTTRIWSAPELNYLPVRFLKQKQGGQTRELLLREVEFIDPQADG